MNDILKPLRLPLADPRAKFSSRHEYLNGERVAESTVNPIWYLEQRRVICTGEPMDTHWNDDGHLCWDINDEPVSNQEFIDHECGVEIWERLHPFLSREEANEYGERTKHHYPDGWRVWCGYLPSGYGLATLLNKIYFHTMKLEARCLLLQQNMAEIGQGIMSDAKDTVWMKGGSETAVDAIIRLLEPEYDHEGDHDKIVAVMPMRSEF